MNQPNQQVIQNAANAAIAANGPQQAPGAGAPVPGYPQGAPYYAPQPPQYQPPQYQPPPQPPVQPPQYQPAYQPYPPYPAQQVQQVQPPEFSIRPKDPRKSGAVRTLNRMGLLMVAQTALSFLLQLALILVCMGAGVNIYGDSLAQVMLSIGLSPICTALPPLIYMIAGRKDWNFHLRFERGGFAGSLLAVLAGLGVCMAANIPAALLEELLESMGAQEIPDVLGQGTGWASFAVEFLGVAVMVPMLEEFAFRGVILSSLRRYGAGFAIAASALIFGMAHMSASSVVFATIAGLAMGAAYVITGNLWVTVAIHALNNGIAVVESYCSLFMDNAGLELVSGAIMIGLCAVGLLALILLLVFRKKLFPKREPVVPADGVLYKPLGAGEAAGAMLKSPVLWAILAMVIVETGMMFL